MEEIENERQLVNNLQKCRCCFRMLIDDRKAVQIDEIIRNQFFSLTQIELISSELFANRICQLCQIDLQTFVDLRKDLVTKQTGLYELAGLDVNEPGDEIQEEQLDDYEIQMIETIKDDEFDNEVILEEIEEEPDEYDESEIIYDDNDSQNIADNVLKIEKIDENEEDTEFIVNYFNDSEMANDQSMSMSESPFESEICETCDMEVLKSHFKEHVELMHGDDNDCNKCHLKFHSKILLRKHINEVHVTDAKNRKMKRKLQYCPLCSKEYDYKKQLMDHIRSYHKKERNTQCTICKRKFYHRDLKKHMQHVHGEKKISCEVCGKLYTCIENLKLHLKYHSDPKYACEYENCDKKFHQKTLWEHHMLKHKNERSISCTECNNTFYTLRDLKRHNQRVHNKVSRKCFGCEMIFCRKDKYREHILKQHKDLSDDIKNKILEQIKNIKWHEN
ncbi:unnamed protein product [Chironomus riparius]|uniref:Uncharacterized protein n=1 Tax=Chironomus riparius TaxID=315576 RepID=A0A9N9WRF7_9DIPT|nr:unnamed protein product [Chironomus riparius]